MILLPRFEAETVIGLLPRATVLMGVLLGFILGPLLEEFFRRALIISRGDPSVFVTRPISAVLLLVAVAALVLSVLPQVRRKREVVFADEEET